MGTRHRCDCCNRRRAAKFFTLSAPIWILKGGKHWCDDCIKEYNRDQNLRKRYGITAEDYDRMAAEQAGRCKSCGDTTDADSHGVGTRLHVDHCHATGKVRGLVCQRCNLVLGHADECADRLRSVIGYLEAA